MITCIVLDGWHKGHVVQMPEELQEIVLLRPPVVTIDDCCDGEIVNKVPSNRHHYKLAFTSIDGETALYTKDGSSKAIQANRDWVRPVDSNWLEQVLYVGIHSPRAVLRQSAGDGHD